MIFYFYELKVGFIMSNLFSSTVWMRVNLHLYLLNLHIQGHSQHQSENNGLFLPKYESERLPVPTGGSPNVVHLIKYASLVFKLLHSPRSKGHICLKMHKLCFFRGLAILLGFSQALKLTLYLILVYSWKFQRALKWKTILRGHPLAPSKGHHIT